MLNQFQIEGKWTEIKGGIRNLWGKISDDELESAKGSMQSVSGIVQKKYGETKESIQQKLDSLMDSFDNATDKSLKLNDGVSSFERNPTAIRTSQVSQNQDSNQDVKTRSPERAKFETKKTDEQDDDYDAEEIFDDTENEDPTYDAKANRSGAEDKIARH